MSNKKQFSVVCTFRDKIEANTKQDALKILKRNIQDGTYKISSPMLSALEVRKDLNFRGKSGLFCGCGP